MRILVKSSNDHRHAKIRSTETWTHKHKSFVAAFLEPYPFIYRAMGSPVQAMITVLLIMFILDGEAHTLVVKPEDGVPCEKLLMSVPKVLPKVIGSLPQAFAASCAEVKVFSIDS